MFTYIGLILFSQCRHHLISIATSFLPLWLLASYTLQLGLSLWPLWEESRCRNRQRTCLANRARTWCSDQRHSWAVGGQSEYGQPHRPGRGLLYPSLCSIWSSFHSSSSRSNFPVGMSGPGWICQNPAARRPHWGFPPRQGDAVGGSWNIQVFQSCCLDLNWLVAESYLSHQHVFRLSCNCIMATNKRLAKGKFETAAVQSSTGSWKLFTSLHKYWSPATTLFCLCQYQSLTTVS